MGQHGFASPLHMRRVDRVSRRLEGEVGFDRATQVERAAMEQRPPAILALMAPDEGGKAGLHFRVDLVQEMLEQNMLGRNSGIGFERKDPVAV